MAGKEIYVDDFVACKTNGLSLQSLISKNSSEQGGTEGWYGIQSINGVTILLDNETRTKSDAGQGYSTTGTTPDTVTTYIRETIKTTIATSGSTTVQQVMDSGVLGSNIEFQGGWNTATTVQEGETFLDGLNGAGRGLFLQSKSFITLNYLNFCRYNEGIRFSSSHNNTIINMTSLNNNYTGITFSGIANYNAITLLRNANNNGWDGIWFYGGCNNIITSLVNANNNIYDGIYFNNCCNNIVTLTNANNNKYGIYSSNSHNNIVKNLSTVGNDTAGFVNYAGTNFLHNVSIGETLECTDLADFSNARLFSHKHDKTAYHRIYTDGGQIDSVATDRPGGTGIMWKLAIMSANRSSDYPLDFKIAKIAVLANKLVTVKVYMKKDHTTNVGGKLVCRGGQLAGVPNDVVDTKADDTNWEELEITFTPTEIGVIEIEAWAYYSAANGNVYVEDMTITQAD